MKPLNTGPWPEHRWRDAASRCLAAPAKAMDDPTGGKPRRPQKAATPKAATPKAPRPQARDAFDVWLSSGLHRLYDDIAEEPPPPALLQLIEAHKARAKP